MDQGAPAGSSSHAGADSRDLVRDGELARSNERPIWMPKNRSTSRRHPDDDQEQENGAWRIKENPVPRGFL